MLGYITYIQMEGIISTSTVYNLHTDGGKQYSKTVKEGSSQLRLLVHALCWCII